MGCARGCRLISPTRLPSVPRADLEMGEFARKYGVGSRVSTKEEEAKPTNWLANGGLGSAFLPSKRKSRVGSRLSSHHISACGGGRAPDLQNVFFGSPHRGWWMAARPGGRLPAVKGLNAGKLAGFDDLVLDN
jgi:hypothetical protein